ncbi:MAG TPA: hypothetical protein P5137_08905 [Candidatus Brocadiia bacterium]|nr:hypothetical protein [Candidatus Brocadiia bacterium]
MKRPLMAKTLQGLISRRDVDGLTRASETGPHMARKPLETLADAQSEPVSKSAYLRVKENPPDRLRSLTQAA